MKKKMEIDIDINAKRIISTQCFFSPQNQQSRDSKLRIREYEINLATYKNIIFNLE